MGVRVSDAFRAGVSTDDYEKMNYGDLIFLYISAYMNMGKQMVEIFHNFIIKVPSKFFRNIFGLISFTEETSGNFGEFISVVSDLTNQKLENIRMSESAIAIVKTSIPISVLIMFIIVIFSIEMVQPIIQQMGSQQNSIFGGGGSSSVSVVDAVNQLSGPVTTGVKFIAPGRGSLGMQDDNHAFILLLYVFSFYIAIGFSISVAMIFKVINEYSMAETIGMTILYMVILLLIMYPLVTKAIFDPNAKTIINSFMSSAMNMTMTTTS